MKRTHWISFLLVATLALAMVAPAVADKYKGFERGDALITPKELKSLMDKNDPKLVVLGVAKGPSYALGHIPGSYNIWRPDYTAGSGDIFPFGGMAMNREQFQEFARNYGIDNDSKVVIYDEKYDATRVWWMFYMYGKTDARVLDGGYPAWKEAGYDTDMGGSPDPEKKGNFVAKPALGGWTASMSDVFRSEKDSDIMLWDTREPNEWDGSKTKKGAYAPGRIPWAKFLSWKDFRNKVDGKPTEFKTAAEIKQVFDKHGLSPDKDHIFYCQSGVRTTTHLFAMYLMGYPIERMHNYDGSWIEWSYYSKAGGTDLNPIHVGE